MSIENASAVLPRTTWAPPLERLAIDARGAAAGLCRMRGAAGVADFGRLHFHGWPAWLLWLVVHLMYLAQFRNRVLVFIRWGFQYLSFDRGARLITGD